ncbi:MAG: polysaccharide deacetylase family protein [Chitinivibrionales bacterium]
MAILKNFLLSSAGWTLRKGYLWQMTSQYSERMQLAPTLLQFRARKNGPPFQILYYHRILPKSDPYAIDAIRVTDFDQQMSMLSGAFNLMTINQLNLALERGIIPPKTACVTFDDGYLDNLLYAAPILKKHHVPATIFLATDFIGTGKTLWPDRIISTVRHTHCSTLSEYFFGIRLPLDSQQTRLAAIKMLLEWFKQFSPERREEHIQHLQSLLGVPPKRERRLMLNWDEVRYMQKAGIEFGSHTVSHPILSHLTDEQIDQEVADSKREIETQIDTPVESFAYPNGRLCDFDERVIGALKNHGYKSAVTTCDSANDATVDPFVLSRESVWEMDANRLFIRMVMKRVLHSQNGNSADTMMLMSKK